jgi:O-acetyl-ADP-ribose deacetylase (regulator of RNase III)
MATAVIEYTKGDLFESRCEALVCPVNLRGVMGAGLAKLFAQRWPSLQRAYKAACDDRELRIGRVWSYALATEEPTHARYVICFPTKDDWKQDSKLEYIAQGLPALVDECQYLEISSVAVPALGCGLGQLPWSRVRDLYQRCLVVPWLRIVAHEPQQEETR